MEDEVNKFNTAEIVVGSMAGLSVDGFCLLLDLTGIGLGIAPLVQGATMFGFSLWLKGKGSSSAFKLNRQIVKQLSNLLPFLPTVTTAFIIETYLHNHPKGLAGKAVQVAGGKIPKA